MKKFSKIICVIFCASFLTSCDKESSGAVVGAVAGGLLGSTVGKGSGQYLAIGAGALAGAFVGNQIGKSMNAKDKQIMNQSYNRSMYAPVNTPVSWNNPQTGVQGSFTTTSEFRERDGRSCREFVQKIYISGKEEVGYGRACRTNNGDWQIVSSGN